MKKRRSIRIDFAIIAAAAMILSSAAVFLTTYFQLSRLVDLSIEEHIKDIMDTFQIEVDFELEQSQDTAERIAQYDRLRDALANADAGAVKDALALYKETHGVPTESITVTDAQGIVVLRMNSDKAGDSLASQNCVASALRGENMAAISTGNTIRMGARAGAAVRNNDNEIIGVVSVTYPFEDNVLVDDVKGDATSEYTIFLGDERLSTTLFGEDGQRIVGTKMSEDIADIVLNQKQEYQGETVIDGNPYTSLYRPILDENGGAIGALFCGVLTSEFKASEHKAVIESIIIAILVAAAATAIVIFYSNKLIVKPVVELCRDTAEIASGNLGVNVTHSSNNELGELADSIRSTVESLQGYIADISTNLGEMAGGNMTVRVDREYVGDFSSIKASLIQIGDSLNGTLSAINKAAGQVAAGSGQVSQGAQSLAQGAMEQASSVQELAASINLISEKISTNANNAQQASAKTNDAVAAIEQVNKTMNQLVDAMLEIKETSAQTNKIVKTIDDIAFQTNILALNAAVEAARAGTAGKGFAVVADEVRNLAGKSAEAVQNTTQLIESIVAAVETGSQYVDEVAGRISSVAESSRQVLEINEMISSDSTDAADSIEQITSGVDAISSVVQTNSATAEQSAAASEELSGQANMLNDEISRFKLRDQR